MVGEWVLFFNERLQSREATLAILGRAFGADFCFFLYFSRTYSQSQHQMVKQLGERIAAIDIA